MITYPVGKEYVKLLKTSDGSILELFTGSLKTTYTNLSTGKAITENTSGPCARPGCRNPHHREPLAPHLTAIRPTIGKHGP